MALAHVTAGTTASASAQNALIDLVNAHESKLAAFQPFIRKAAQETITNNTTPQNDDHLVLALGPGVWQISARLVATGPAAADIRLVWVLGGDAVQLTTRHCVGPTISTGDVTSGAAMRASTHFWNTIVGYGTDGTSTGSSIQEDGLIQVTASGSIQLQWAQNTANATGTILTANSYMYATRMA